MTVQLTANDTVLAQKLIETGNAKLVEGNCWGDKFWGVCKGEGKNNLGLILMKVRGELSGTGKCGGGCEISDVNEL